MSNVLTGDIEWHVLVEYMDGTDECVGCPDRGEHNHHKKTHLVSGRGTDRTTDNVCLGGGRGGENSYIDITVVCMKILHCAYKILLL